MKFIKLLLSLSYFTVLIYIVFFARRRRHLSERFINMVPIKNTVHTFVKLNPLEHREVYNFYTNLFGNIALFVPFSIILILVFKLNNKKTIMLLAFVLSLSIEFFQYLLLLGVADIDDILLNTLGAFIGVISFTIIQNKYKLIF